MNTKILSSHALSVIDQYLHFKIGNAECSVPYFNNKNTQARATMRVRIGKGSSQEISEEIQDLAIKNHIAIKAFSNNSLKKLLIDNNIGIDCSAFTYYILNAESEERKKGHLYKNLSFANCHGLLGKIRCSLRPIENCDVITFANDKNSHAVAIKEIEPGNMITMIGERDHILVIHQVEYQNSIPIKIHYSHAVAYPEDGPYGSGIRQGEIQIVSPDKDITEQKWIEGGNEGNSNRLFVRAQKSKTEIRRLKWF